AAFLDSGTSLLVIQGSLVRIWDLVPLLRRIPQAGQLQDRLICDQRVSADGRRHLVARVGLAPSSRRPGPSAWEIEVTDERSGESLLGVNTAATQIGSLPGPGQVRLAPGAEAVLALTAPNWGQLALRGWDLRTGKPLVLPEQPPGDATRLFMSPDSLG